MSRRAAMGPAALVALAVLHAAAGCASPPAPPALPAVFPAPPPAATARAAAAPPTAISTAAPARSAALPEPGMSPQDMQAITAHHNKVRADVGVPPLKWSAELAGYAQQWAEQLAISNCQMKHRSPNAYGENLFQGTFGAFTAVDAAKAWETEKKDFGGGVLTEANWARAGHYTQMVWQQTTQVGCGQSICNSTLIVACNYNPPGNVIGRRPY